MQGNSLMTFVPLAKLTAPPKIGITRKACVLLDMYSNRSPGFSRQTFKEKSEPKAFLGDAPDCMRKIAKSPGKEPG